MLYVSPFSQESETDTQTHRHTHTHDVKTITPFAGAGCNKLSNSYLLGIALTTSLCQLSLKQKQRFPLCHFFEEITLSLAYTYASCIYFVIVATKFLRY